MPLVEPWWKDRERELAPAYPPMTPAALKASMSLDDKRRSMAVKAILDAFPEPADSGQGWYRYGCRGEWLIRVGVLDAGQWSNTLTGEGNRCFSYLLARVLDEPEPAVVERLWEGHVSDRDRKRLAKALAGPPGASEWRKLWDAARPVTTAPVAFAAARSGLYGLRTERPDLRGHGEGLVALVRDPVTLCPVGLTHWPTLDAAPERYGMAGLVCIDAPNNGLRQTIRIALSLPDAIWLAGHYRGVVLAPDLDAITGLPPTPAAPWRLSIMPRTDADSPAIEALRQRLGVPVEVLPPRDGEGWRGAGSSVHRSGGGGAVLDFAVIEREIARERAAGKVREDQTNDN